MVVGVIMGVGNFSFSFIPSGSVTPQIVRFPALYSRHALPVKYPRIIISKRKPSQRNPTVTIGSGVAIFQFGTISLVASKNLAAIWFNT